jgi:hypothetical protein
MDPPAAPVRDAGELLDVDVDQLAGPVPLIAAHRFSVSGPISAVEPSQTGAMQDRLHRGGRQPGLMGDVAGTPPAAGA